MIEAIASVNEVIDATTMASDSVEAVAIVNGIIQATEQE